MKSERPILKPLLLVFVFIMPFLQGLYFYFELFAVISILIVCLLILLKTKETIQLNMGQLAFYVLFALLSLISVLYAVDPGMAMLGALKIFSYGIFFIVIQIVVDKTYKKHLLMTMILSGVTMALIGMFSFLTDIGSDYLIQGNRLGGFFQYANTFGVFLLVCLLLLFMGSYRFRLTLLLGTILTIGIVLTMSRGTIILLFIGMIGVLVIRKAAGWYQQLVVLLLGIIVSVVIIQAVEVTTITRLAVGTSASELHTRLLYYKDGLEMFLKHPFGTGHMGYFYIQKAFQTGANYSVKYIHSNLIQVLLDIGFLGGITFLSYILYQITDKGIDHRYRFLFLLTMVHGLIDFDLQFGVIWFLLIILTIKTSPLDPAFKVIHLKRKRPIYMGIVVMGLLYIVATFVTTLQYTNHSFTAVRMYPYYTEAKISMLRDTEYDETTRLNIALELQKVQANFVESFAYIRDYDYNNKDYEAARKNALICMEKNPMNLHQVEAYSQVLVSMVEAYIEADRYDEAIIIIGEIYGIPNYLENLNAKKGTDLNINHKVTFMMTRQLNQDYYTAVRLHEFILSK
ncbi:MAG: O-antigen ligase family protein [Vallitaleaceae bacterium]|jgi:hypothetical protein|nr:O-antigen ligase family protein [Vallitaleaceae bacterium]